MTLGNMRANGVRSLAVACHPCRHEAVLSADRWHDDVPVRMVCTRCVSSVPTRGPTGLSSRREKR
jgi:hypothetical protein